MIHRVYGAHARTAGWRYIAPEAILIFVFSLMLLVPPVGAAALRFQERSMYMNDTRPGAETYYKVSFKYMSELPVGSVDMLFCVDPIPYHACVPPEGLDVSNAELASQTGEMGFSILSKSTNHIVLSRSAATVPVDKESSYTLDKVINPSNTAESFSLRLRSHASFNASGPQTDFGSIKGQVTTGIMIETQVPPMLIFCLAEEVHESCGKADDEEDRAVYYRDMGQLNANGALTAQSQMAVGTNASRGFVITMHGTPMSAGINVIDSPVVPTPSIPGTNQFGVNLVENNELSVGRNPEGPWTNAIVADGYNESNKFKYVPGDVVAYSPSVSLMRKFTVSYMVNAAPSLKAGVYSTTVTYIASGRF